MDLRWLTVVYIQSKDLGELWIWFRFAIDFSRWWFQIFVCSPRSLGNWSNLTSIFFKWVETQPPTSCVGKDPVDLNYTLHKLEHFPTQDATMVTTRNQNLYLPVESWVGVQIQGIQFSIQRKILGKPVGNPMYILIDAVHVFYTYLYAPINDLNIDKLYQQQVYVNSYTIDSCFLAKKWGPKQDEKGSTDLRGNPSASICPLVVTTWNWKKLLDMYNKQILSFKLDQFTMILRQLFPKDPGIS